MKIKIAFLAMLLICAGIARADEAIFCVDLHDRFVAERSLGIRAMDDGAMGKGARHISRFRFPRRD